MKELHKKAVIEKIAHHKHEANICTCPKLISHHLRWVGIMEAVLAECT